MKWFTGDIATAINLAKSRGAIFVVYCEGKDDNSKHMTELINDREVSESLESHSFVAIKVESDKEEYMQFAKIYQLVPVPSLFFIKNGVPLKILTNTVKTSAELLDAIKSIITNESSPNIPQQQVSQSSTSVTSESTVMTPNDEEKISKLPKKVQFTSSTEVSPSEEKSPEKSETEAEKQAKIQKAMKLIEQKRIERIEQEQRDLKEREIQRRKEGQAVQDLKKWQEDQEMKQIKEDRKKEKDEAKAARQRVLDQIEQDKKERAQRFGTQTSPPEQKTPPVTPPAPTTPASNIARIQFKKPNGESEVVSFDSDMLFADLHLFVKNDVLQGASKDFVLATTFPRREFSEENFKQTLAELNLTPSAVLLIILGKKKTSTSGLSTVLPTQTNGSFFDMIRAMLASIFSPVMVLFGYISNFLTRTPQADAETPNEAGKRKRNEELLMANDAAKKRNLNAFNNQAGPSEAPRPSSSPTGTIPKSSAYKRPITSNNIHRLHQDSDDEEKKTYNGNSTQQM